MKKVLSLFACLACGAVALSGLTAAEYRASAQENKAVVATEENVSEPADIQEVFVGDLITVEDKILSYGDQTKTVSGQIIAPDGASYQGSRFTATRSGIYTVVYKAYFVDNGKTVEVDESVQYRCKQTGADMFSYNDAVTASYAEYAYSTSTTKHAGVAFDVKSGAEITFDTVLNPTLFDLETPLIDLIVEPSQIGVDDFTGLKIRVTDVEDPSNYVEYICVDGGYIDGDGTCTYVRAGFKGGISAGWAEHYLGSHYITSNTGTGLSHSFHAYPQTEPTHDLRLYLDYANKSAYGAPGALTYDAMKLINDFTNKTLYKFNPWEGFTSDKVQVSIIPNNFKAASGRLIVKSIAGIDFSQEVLEDTQAPEITVDYAGQDPYDLPLAKVGTDFNIFSATAADNYDADVPVNVAVTYRDTQNAKNVDVYVKDGKFRVQKAGYYTINYTAVDSSGNASKKVRVGILAEEEIPALRLTLGETSSQTEMYEEVRNLPLVEDVTVVGGTGKIDVVRKVYDPSGKEITVTGRTIVPEELGDYKIVFTATDYIGNTAESVYTLQVGDTAAKFVDEVSLPPVLLKGFTYTLPKVNALETQNGVKTDIAASVSVNGVPCNDFTFTASEGNEAVITYTAQGATGEAEPLVYVLPVVDGQDTVNQAAYFYSADGKMTATKNKDDVTLSASSDGSAIFANRLDANNFALNLTLDSEKTNYQTIVITLTDAANTAVSVTLKLHLTKAKGEVTAELETPDERVSFIVSNNEMTLQYENGSRLISDIQNNEIGMCATDDNGEPFNGFVGGVYVTIGLQGVKGDSAIVLTKLNNHSLGYQDGELSKDSYDPVINFNSSLVSKQKFGEDFVYPTFEAMDVFSEIAEATITIKNPDGDTVKKVNGDVYEPFKIEKYGKYKLTYYAEDTCGNSIRLTREISVSDDVTPTLEVNALKKTKYSVGDKVKVPTYVAKDNLDELYVDVILILPNNEPRLLSRDENGKVTYYLNNENLYPSTFRVDENSFKAEYKGEYTIRYVAYDGQYNKTAVELKFTVK